MASPSKDELERQKLALEIQELQRKWWQRPAYLSILLPVALAALTVLAGILSGYFDRERTELKRKSEALKTENAALLETQEAIRLANEDAKKRLEGLKAEYEKLREEYVRHNQQARQAYEALVAEALPGERAEVIKKLVDRLLPRGIPTPTPTPSE